MQSFFYSSKLYDHPVYTISKSLKILCLFFENKTNFVIALFSKKNTERLLSQSKMTAWLVRPYSAIHHLEVSSRESTLTSSFLQSLRNVIKMFLSSVSVLIALCCSHKQEDGIKWIHLTEFNFLNAIQHVFIRVKQNSEN